MYRLTATQCTESKRVEENANVSFFETQIKPRVHWFVACYVLLLTEIVRELWPITLEWIEFGCVHINSTRERRIGLRIPAAAVRILRRHKLVTETGLIVRRQYNRLSQQQQSFLFEILHWHTQQ